MNACLSDRAQSKGAKSSLVLFLPAKRVGLLSNISRHTSIKRDRCRGRERRMSEDKKAVSCNIEHVCVICRIGSNTLSTLPLVPLSVAKCLPRHPCSFVLFSPCSSYSLCTPSAGPTSDTAEEQTTWTSDEWFLENTIPYRIGTLAFLPRKWMPH